MVSTEITPDRKELVVSGAMSNVQPLTVLSDGIDQLFLYIFGVKPTRLLTMKNLKIASELSCLSYQ